MDKTVKQKPKALVASTVGLNLNSLSLLALFTAISMSVAQAQSNYSSFCRAILTKQEIVLSGGIVVDSFNSQEPSLSTNGRYDRTKHSDGGNIASTSDSVKTITEAGSAKVYGRVATGTNGTVITSGNAAMGSLAWVDGGNRGVQPGWYTNNVEEVIPDAQLPALTFATMPKTRGTIDGVTYQYVLTTGNYRESSKFAMQSSQKMAISGNVVLYFPDGLSLSGSAYIHVMPGSKLTVYLGGSSSLSGKGVVNGTGFATNCTYIGLPTCVTIDQSGSSDFIGTIYAPGADVKLAGGATATTHFIGAVVARSVKMSGHAELHYDQSLCGPKNRAPVANDDSYTTPEGTVLAIGSPGVLANDTDPEMNSLSAVLVSGTTHGALTFSSNGSFNYAPVANYIGADSFTYRATDGTATSALATVTITVLPKPIVIVEPPVNRTNCPGNDVNFSVTATGTALTYQWFFGTNLLSGQTNHTLLLGGVNASSAGTYCVVVSSAAGGLVTSCATLVVNENTIVTVPPADQTACENAATIFRVTASGTALSYQWYYGSNGGTLLAGQTGDRLVLTNVTVSSAGVYTVVVRGACGAAVTNSAMLTVNQNLAIVTAPANQTSFVGSNVTFSIVAAGTGLTYQWLFNGSVIGTNSTLTLNSLTTNRAGTYCVVVRGACGSPVTNCTLLTIKNRAPIAINDDYSVAEDNVLMIGAPGVLDNDSDPDGDTLRTILVTGPAHGTLSLNADGSFTYRPNTDYNGPDAFTYRANDLQTSSAPATVTITVTPVNDRPVPGIEGDNYTAFEDRILTVAAPGVLANDTDADNDVLRAVLVSGPWHGTLALNANGSFTYRPQADYFGSDSFEYAANDGISNSLPATVNIKVLPVNDAPSFTKGPDQRVNRNVSQQQIPNWARNISPGPANESYQSINFVVSNDNYTLFSAQPSIAPDGTLTFTPHPNVSGIAVVTVVLHDDGGTDDGGVDCSGEATFRIMVNDPPVVCIVSPTNGSVYIGPTTFTIVAKAVDSDGAVTNVQFLSNGSVIGNVATAPFYLVWTNVAAGNHALLAIATDDEGLCATSSVVNVTVISNAVVAVGPIVLNRQNGLFEQFVTVSNSTLDLWPNGVRLWIHNLDSTNQVWNPTGTNNGVIYIEKSESLSSGGTMVFLIQYYIPNPRSFPTPTLVAVPLPYTRSAERPRITRIVADGGRNNIHFTTLGGRYYFVQRSEDLVHWTTVPEPMQGTGEVIVCPQNRDVGKRFYRVMMVP